MKAFVDTSAWFAAANVKDRHNQRAIELLSAGLELITSTFVLVETWLILQSKMSFAVAEDFAGYVRLGAAKIESNEMSDLEYSWRVREAFQDQPFSLVDRTSFAMMERLQISKVVSFDHDFVIYRYGPDRRQAFEVLR
jgi:predicted nucleic acid-binding protein